MRANVVIFSKDRPAQVDACIRSLLQNCRDKLGADFTVSVLYKASTEDFSLGYEKCKTRQPEVEWKRQRHDLSFKKDLWHLFKGKEGVPLTMFLVDDIMFRDTFSFFDPEIQSVSDGHFLLACSLRLDKNITQCYATSSPSKIPSFVKGNVWQWYGSEGDWGYPWSVDGNIYRTEDALRKLINAEYCNPNQLEAHMNLTNYSLVGLGTPEKPSYMNCYVEKSKLVNIPANRVQDEYRNRVGNIMSVEEMNHRFLSGEEISMETVKDVENSTVHVELPIIWVKSVTG